MDTPGYPMRLVSRRTGLTPHAIRAWEKRYGAITPARSETNRRYYSEDDVERLILLRDATAAGHSIGQIARLPSARLRQLITSASADPLPAAAAPAVPADFVESALEAMGRMDAVGLESILARASVNLSRPELLEHVIAPVLEEAGRGWQEGRFKIAHEHLLSAVVRSLLGSLSTTARRLPGTAPCMISTTPQGQLHELGAMLAAVTAASEGWRVLYLGPDLPSQEIAAAARAGRARCVALSLVFPPDDPQLPARLADLRRALDPETRIIAGGRVAPSYRAALEEIGAALMADLAGLRRALRDMRSVAAP